MGLDLHYLVIGLLVSSFFSKKKKKEITFFNFHVLGRPGPTHQARLHGGTLRTVRLSIGNKTPEFPCPLSRPIPGQSISSRNTMRRCPQIKTNSGPFKLASSPKNKKYKKKRIGPTQPPWKIFLLPTHHHGPHKHATP